LPDETEVHNTKDQTKVLGIDTLYSGEAETLKPYDQRIIGLFLHWGLD
jgi:hypothetical protein